MMHYGTFSRAVRRLTGGYAYVNNKPGLGIDIDEAKAAKYPCEGGIPHGQWLARLTAPLPDRNTFVLP